MKKNHLFCFGLGYTARYLAGRLLDSGWQVSGTCRSPDTAETLRKAGMETWLFNEDQPLTDLALALDDVTHLLSSVPPGTAGDPVLAVHGPDLPAAARQLAWIGYLSTIGVYGDQRGGWVDEDTPTRPDSVRSERRLLAEQGWVDLGRQMNVPTHLFRLPGIYGPGQRNQVAALKAGRARRIVKPGQVFNRIHVHDLTSVAIASMNKPDGSVIYNIADDEPAPAAEIVSYAAKLLGTEPPPEEAYEDAEMSESGRRFYEECKRVSNRRIKEELGIRLRYPTYREGLEAIVAESE